MSRRLFCRVATNINIYSKRKCYLLKNYVSRNSSNSTETEAVMMKGFGDPRKVLTMEKCMVRQPSENEVVVKMLMAPINPSDINMIEGTYHIRPDLPCIVGNEGVGEIIEVGRNVENFRKGDWVLPSEPAWGTWRRLATTSESKVQKIDNKIPVLSAATIMVNQCTAYRMLKDFEHLNSRDVIIQNGANSAVGQCVIQIAKEWNIKTINVVRDRPDIEDLKTHLTKLGATHVVTEEFVRTTEMKDLIKSYEQKPKLALNCVGGKSATELVRFLREKGTMVTYGGMSKKPLTIPTGALIFKEIKIMGYWNTQWNAIHKNSTEKREMFQDLCGLIKTGKLLPSQSELIPFSKFQEAIHKSLEGFQDSKKVLLMDQ